MIPARQLCRRCIENNVPLLVFNNHLNGIVPSGFTRIREHETDGSLVFPVEAARAREGQCVH